MENFESQAGAVVPKENRPDTALVSRAEFPSERSAAVEIRRNLLLSLLVCSLPEDNAGGNDLARAYTGRKDCVHKLSQIELMAKQ